MEILKSYVKEKINFYQKNQNTELEKFNTIGFSDFLTRYSECYYKHGCLLGLFNIVNEALNDDISKHIIFNSLTTMRRGFEQSRLHNNPVNFSTNPMANLIKLWEFELYAEYIKYIDKMLSMITIK